MGWTVLTFGVLLPAVFVVTGYRIVENDGKTPFGRLLPSTAPAFLRDAVESPPHLASDRYSARNDVVQFGSRPLPLRTAVEAPPDVTSWSGEPLRAAVEKIPEREYPRFLPNDAGTRKHNDDPFDDESIWLERLGPPSVRKKEDAAKIVCHMESWNRGEQFTSFLREIPRGKCTHLVYGVAAFDPYEPRIHILRDAEHHQPIDGFASAFRLRKKDPSARILITIELPDHGRLYERAAMWRDTWLRGLGQATVNFLEQHGLDGIWLKPSSTSDERFKLLLSALYGPLSSRGLVVAVLTNVNDSPDPELAEITDLLMVEMRPMTTKLTFPFGPVPPFNFFMSTVQRWLDARVDPEKIVLGVPLLGVHDYLAKASEFVDRYEICPIFQGGQLPEDPPSIELGAAYVKSAGIGGISLIGLDLDYFTGICGESWPKLTSIGDILGKREDSAIGCDVEGLFGDPANCAGYLSCDRGRLYSGNCGVGRFFDGKSGRCAMARPELCKPGDSGRRAIGSKDRRKQHLRDDSRKGPRVVCYVTSWSSYREGDGKFVPERIDTRLCTDVIYAFAGLNPETLEVQTFDPWADVDNDLYNRVTSINGSKVLLGLGGWTDSAGDKYSRLVADPIARRRFVESTVSFLQRHGFDGLSLEWLYPRCWKSDCKKGPKTDRPNFSKLVQELGKEFEAASPRLTLAVAISGYKEIIDIAYEIPEISRAVEFISVMTYDYHGGWDSSVGHSSPLYSTPGDTNPYYNINFTINYIASLGAPKSKLLVGIPFYGQTFRLSQNDRYRPGDPTSGAGAAGEFTNQPGMLAYYEICDRVRRKGWKIAEGPSAHFNDQLVVCEDPESTRKKGEWIIANGFGGATAWTIDLDDFTNRCCKAPFPLLANLNRGLGRLAFESNLNREDCSKPAEPVTPEPPRRTTHSDAIEGGQHPTSPAVPSTTTTIRTTSKATTWPTWTESSSKKPATTATSEWLWTTSVPTTVSTTSRPTTVFEWTSSSTLSTPSPSSPAGAACNTGEYVADPTNCGSYFRCVLGELKRERCAPGLHWSDSKGRCDWPAAAKCPHGSSTVTTRKPTPTPIPTITAQRPTIATSRKPSTTTTTQPTTTITTRPTTTTTMRSTTTTTRPTTAKPLEECEHGRYYAYPNSCVNFLICVNGNLVTQQCGPGLNWHDEKNMCDWAFKNPCPSTEKRKMNAPFVTGYTEQISEECISGSFSGIPGDCESYRACLWGHHEKFQCPPGLHFSEESRICDWPSRAKCQPENEEAFPPSIPEEGSTDREETTTRTTTTTASWSTTRKPWTEAETPKPTLSTTAPPEIMPAEVAPFSGRYKVVCYFTNWAWYRKGSGRYVPEDIDDRLCTHIIYGFAVLDYSNLVIKAHDSWADFDNRFYERVVAYKKRGLKVLLALGGWNDSAGDKYSRLVNSPAARKKFIEHAIEFIEKYGFDGLDLDWEYPVCWQVDCRKGRKSDKEGFAALLKELSAKLRPKGLLLSSAVSPSKRVIDEGYDVPTLAKYLDWIAVMTYDFHGQWEKKTGHVAPLYYREEDEFYFFNANYSINYWISKGAPPKSIVMGIPLYGQSFTLNDPKAGTGLEAPASAGNAGEFTRAAGFLAYYEICDRIRNRGWTVVQDPKQRMGPYARKGSQWVSYDDVDMVRRKAQYIRNMGLGGGMIWALDLDDFRGKCGEGKHPLLHTLQGVLAEESTENDTPIAPPAVGQELEWKLPLSPAATASDTMVSSMSDRIIDDADNGFKVVCYFTNWAWYRQDGGRYVPEDIDAELCTHIIYGFAVLDGTTLTIKPHDSWADIDNRFYERVLAYKKKGIKVLVAIGGWNDSAGDKYSRLVNSATSRTRFVTDVVQFIEKYGFEGLDLDWEYPVCWQVDCNRGPASDKESFGLFVKELSETFKPKGLLLSSAVSPSKRVINEGYDVPTIAKYLDWISVMTYDFHGQWDKKTGHVAPLYEHPLDWEPTFNANFSIHYWIEQGAPPKKLVMGAPLYGQSFSLADTNERGLNAPTYGGGEAGEATRARGFLSYYEICDRTLRKGWNVVQDPERRMGPYAYKGDQWVSFDDAEQIKLKAEFIVKMGLGGGMVWALDLDDFKNRCECEPSPLLRTMNRVLRNYPKGPTCRVTVAASDAFVPTIPLETTTQPPSVTGPIYLPNPPTEMIDLNDTIEIIAGPPPPVLPPIGECDGRLFIPHKEDCSKYLVCNFGELSERSCPNGLYWNEDRCDWPQNSKCKNNRTIQIESSNAIPQSEQRRNARLALDSQHLVQRETSADGENKKIVCYLSGWSQYRSNVGRYLPENIEPDLCTHIIYGFAVLDSDELVMTMHDSRTEKDFYPRVTAYRAKGIRVSVALGGWNDSAGDKYSRLVNDPSAREKFIKHAVEFIEKYEFDGLDLAWEYPVCWQVNCEQGVSTDKESFATFVRELSDAFRPRNLLLSAAVSASKRVIDRGYDVPTLGKYLDWIAVMTYDFHGPWEKKTGHVAPLYSYPGDESPELNANFSMRYWMEKGAPASRLVMGLPLYGQSFTLSNAGREELGAAASGPGEPGPFTQATGFLAFYEICDKVRNDGWRVSKDPERRIGPFATRGDQWVSYDDVSNIVEKAAFIRELGLAGGMIWALDLDDFGNNCGCGKYPLLSALEGALRHGIVGKDCT